MLTDKETAHIAGLVPCRLARHIVGDHLTIYDEVLESDIFNLTVLAVAIYYRHLLSGTIVRDVPESNIFDAAARGKAVFLVIEYPDVHQLSLTKILDPDILEQNIANEIFISGIF